MNEIGSAAITQGRLQLPLSEPDTNIQLERSNRPICGNVNLISVSNTAIGIDARWGVGNTRSRRSIGPGEGCRAIRKLSGFQAKALRQIPLSDRSSERFTSVAPDSNFIAVWIVKVRKLTLVRIFFDRIGYESFGFQRRQAAFEICDAIDDRNTR